LRAAVAREGPSCRRNTRPLRCLHLIRVVSGIRLAVMRSRSACNVAGDRRLGRRNRLVSSIRFAEIFAVQHSVARRNLVMWSAPSVGAEGVRVGVIASKRTFRRAVDRSRAKRMLREAFRMNRMLFNSQVDIVLVARHRILGAVFGDIERDLLEAARRLGALNPEKGEA
jgi:ribonuclease P protein component